MTESNPVRRRPRTPVSIAAVAMATDLLPSLARRDGAAVPDARRAGLPSISRPCRSDREASPRRGRATARLVGAAGTSAKLLRRYGAILAFFAAWQLVSQLGLVDKSIVPSFIAVVGALIHGFADGGLADNMLVSLRRSGTAFAIAISLAIPLGLFMGSFRRFEAVVDPLIQLFRQTSALAIYPIFILWLGLGETSKVTIICWAAFFPVLLNTISGVKQVDARLIEMARVFGASKAAVFRRVVLPSATPAIFVGLRLGATTSLLLLVAAEMIGAKEGLGFLIINSQYNFEIPLMFAAIVLLAIIGLAVNYGLLLLQQRLCRWENPGRGNAPVGGSRISSRRRTRLDANEA
jgi:sulfonate transport system permease protein